MVDDYKKLISIIVPVYNIELYVSKCIRSIINQTYKKIEIILVDDGSTDNSGIICDDFSKYDNRIIVIHKNNNGLSDARNAGLKIATGDLIGFVDGDDYIEPDMYELLFKNMRKFDSDISICGIKKIVELNVSYYYDNYTIEEFKSEGKDKFHNLINKYSNLSIVAWNKLYKREIFDKIEYPKGMIYEDRYIICDILNAAKSVSYITKPLYNHFKREGSITNILSYKKSDWIISFNKNISFLKYIGYDEIAYEISIRKCKEMIIILSEMINKRIIVNLDNDIYFDLLETSKEIKWKDSNKYVKRLKIFRKGYIYFRAFEYRVWSIIKKIIYK